MSVVKYFESPPGLFTQMYHCFTSIFPIFPIVLIIIGALLLGFTIPFVFTLLSACYSFFYESGNEDKAKDFE
jgi:hypothetical protein